jgi:hypothetical protein
VFIMTVLIFLSVQKLIKENGKDTAAGFEAAVCKVLIDSIYFGCVTVFI